MEQNKSIKALVDKIRIVESEAELNVLLETFKPQNIKKPVRIAFINAHGFNLCHSDPAFLHDVLQCDYIFRDGAGMNILYKLLGRDAGLNLNGTDLIPRIVELYAGYEAALMGTTSPYLEKAAERFTTKEINVSHLMDGFKSDADYVAALAERPCPLVVLAMGMPKQERVARQIVLASGKPALIVCGGAILDFMGGKVTRAPEVFRKYGMEWFYRLMLEPKRLFKRYVLGNFVFLYRALGIAFAQRPEKGSGRPLKILHVVRQFAPAIGGLESYVMSMAGHQQAKGYDIEVLTLNKVFHGDTAELPANETIHGIKVKRVGFWGRRRFFIPRISPFYFTKFDVVHVHNTDVFYDYVALVAAFLRVPAVATTHGGFFHTGDFGLIKKIYFQTITRFSSFWYKAIFAISGNDRDTFKGLNKNIILQPNAVEPLGTDISEGRDFLYIGRIAKSKNVPDIVRVFALMKHEHNVDGKLHLIGPAWDVSMEELQLTAAKLRVAEHIVFHGASERAEMMDIAQKCGYFLSASSFEGFGMSMLEAMSVGIIPFVQGNESFIELVEQGGVGTIVDFQNPEKAAREIAESLPKIDDTMRQKAQNFSHTFSWAELVDKADAVYKDSIS